MDAYSCIKYILSYISKKESEESNLLKKAQEECREGNLSVAAELKKNGTFLLNTSGNKCNGGSVQRHGIKFEEKF